MNDEENKQIEKFPEGHFISMWTGIGIAIFAGLGVPISFITGNHGLIGIGPAIGVVIGAAIGNAVEEKKKKGKIRPLTEAEKIKRKKALITAFVLLGLGVVILILILILL